MKVRGLCACQIRVTGWDYPVARASFGIIRAHSAEATMTTEGPVRPGRIDTDALRRRYA